MKKQNGDLSSAKLIGENANVVRIMSIHKSKGLEFPVVFLCNVHKKFNLRDLNEIILMHQDLGIGPILIDTKKRVKYPTTIKQAIALKVKQETLSEEERILYVALTRAKEKLIITGRSRDIQKELKEKQENLATYILEDGGKLDSKLIKNGRAYLDWIEYVYLLNSGKNITLKGKKLGLDDIIELKTFAKKDLIKELQVQEKVQDDEIEKVIEKEAKKQENIEQIQKVLDWKYQNEVNTKLPTKTSVSKLKQEQQGKLLSLEKESNWEDETEEYLNENENEELKYIKLETLEDLKTSDITPAQKGTLVHLCIQKINEKLDYTIEGIEKLINNLLENEMITEVEAQAIDRKLIYSYTQSELFKTLKNAKEIHKEQPFYINIPAKEIFEEAQKVNSKKDILVQGIIDLYYIDEYDRINLIDFKTDYVPKGKEKEVAEKYKLQIEIYKKALEQAFGKKVTKAQICLANSNWRLF